MVWWIVQGEARVGKLRPMRAALRDRPVVRFVFLAVFFGAFTQAGNALLGEEASVVQGVIGGLFFAVFMTLALRYLVDSS
jgi:hypothetical protein